MARRKLETESPDVKTRFQPGHAPLVQNPKPPKTWTPEQTRAQIRIVEDLMIRGASQQQIARQMRTLDVGATRTKTLMDRIRASWERENEASRATNKMAAERRLIRTIEDAKGDVDDKGHHPNANWSAVMSAEKLLADIQGTREPVKINLDLQVSAAVGNFIATMTPEMIQQAISEMNQLQNDAENWRRMPALPPAPATRKH